MLLFLAYKLEYDEGQDDDKLCILLRVEGTCLENSRHYERCTRDQFINNAVKRQQHKCQSHNDHRQQTKKKKEKKNRLCS